MEPLTEKKCAPCEGIPPLEGRELTEYQSQLKERWDVVEGKRIRRKFEFKDFVDAVAFVNKVADIAEQENHHPDITINYNKVTIALSTHSIGGLSENDFIVAAKIEGLTLS